MDFVLRSYVFLTMLPTTLVDRLHREDRGQTAAEYLGVILVIAALIALLIANNIGEALRTNIVNAINTVFKKGGGSPPGG
jgi:Flp pilus assembly pilin Flp